MKERILISMIAFIDKEAKPFSSTSLMDELETKSRILDRVMEYKEFLRQLMELWMFVPCGKDGRPLKEPYNYQRFLKMHSSLLVRQTVNPWTDEELENGDGIECLEYEKALERVIFEGFTKDRVEVDDIYERDEHIVHMHNDGVNPYRYIINDVPIEDFVKFNLTLTPNVIKDLL